MESVRARDELTFHHVGVAVRSIEEARRYYSEALGFRPVSGVIPVEGESVRVCFLEIGEGVLVELIEGVGENSPVAGLLRRNGPGPYHLCYRTPDLEAAIARLRARGFRPLRSFEQRSGGLRRFAFLATPDGQLVELCEPDPEPSQPGRTGRSYSFKALFFEATRRCNLACPMCMASSNDPRAVRASRQRELSTDEIERHVLAAAPEIGIASVLWSGGEFLLRPDAVELVRRATRHGLDSSVCTNGEATTREQLEELMEASAGTLAVAVGINSIEGESSWTRDAECDKSVALLDTCKELGIRRHVVVNVGRHNLRTLERTLQWLEDQNIPYNRSPFTARGSGRAYWDELHVTREEMERVVHPALRKHANGYVSFTPFFLSPELHQRISKGQRNVTVPQGPSIGCWCGTWLAVNAEGYVSPCGILLDEVTAGNVREKSLYRIVDESPVFQNVLDRDRLEGKCGRCRYKLTCGGCRAMAWFHSGNLMGEDPTCFFEPEDETTVSEHEEETNKMFRRYAFMARFAGGKV